MDTISNRLKQAMALRQKKQVDIVNETGINKGALSSYISGKYQPKQNNIYLIAEALEVNEAWLMGYDVPMERQSTAETEATAMPETLAVQFEGDSFTAQELEEITQFIKFVKSKRNK